MRNVIKTLIDRGTNSIKSVDYAHNEIHAWGHYCININKDITNGWTYNLAFTTPNSTKWCHMLFGVSCELEADVILYENITSFTWGTAVTPINNNRNSANTSWITNMAFDVTATAGTPTTIAQAVIGSGKNFWWWVRNDSEFVLKANTVYYMVVTNQATWASNETNLNLCRYEHTNK